MEAHMLKNALIFMTLSTVTVSISHPVFAFKNGDRVRSVDKVPHYKKGYNFSIIQCSNKDNLGVQFFRGRASTLKKTRKGNHYAWIERRRTYIFPSGEIAFRRETSKQRYKVRISAGKPRTMRCR